ncbi:MAG: helix-turn-helix domain-containing protein [Candidatus Marisimplicoccus sp.]|jgi:transcriptional regulator with XRE-family HTH domain|tara:strand:- start:3 stop:374 length:372 start_codon:yes stop_codon:yes gene_type:complete
MNKKNILNRIKKIISDNNLSNSEFAEKIGIPKSSVSHLLSERNNPSLDVIIKISEIFEDISTDYLIFGYKSDKEIPTEPLNNLFDDLNKETSKDSVKDSNNNIKSIILIYENNKFEQIDKLKD